jgi:hypothetical protein
MENKTVEKNRDKFVIFRVTQAEKELIEKRFGSHAKLRDLVLDLLKVSVRDEN